MITATQLHKNMIELTDKTLIGKTLVLDVSETGFEFAVFTAEPITITRIGELTFQEELRDLSDLNNYFSQFIGEFGLNNIKFQNIYVNWLSKNFTMVPASFYSPEKSKELLAFNVGEVNNETILTNDVTGDIKLIYSVPTELKQNIDKIFPNHTFNHNGYSNIQSFFSHYQLKNNDVFLNIHNNQIELMIKKDKKLLLYNVFNTKSNEDILYYLMFSVEQFNLDPVTLRLALAGNRATTDELFKTIKKYIKNSEFVSSDKIIVRKEAFETIPHHYYFLLLNRLLCV